MTVSDDDEGRSPRLVALEARALAAEQELLGAYRIRNSAVLRATCMGAVVQAAQAWARGDAGAEAWLRDALRTYEEDGTRDT